jgi:hypothetical protein
MNTHSFPFPRVWAASLAVALAAAGVSQAQLPNITATTPSNRYPLVDQLPRDYGTSTYADYARYPNTMVTPLFQPIFLTSINYPRTYGAFRYDPGPGPKGVFFTSINYPRTYGAYTQGPAGEFSDRYAWLNPFSAPLGSLNNPAYFDAQGRLQIPATVAGPRATLRGLTTPSRFDAQNRLRTETAPPERSEPSGATLKGYIPGLDRK